MMVTKLEPVTKIKYKIYLDGTFAFALYKGELSKFGIKEGKNITDEQKNKIMSEVIIRRAKLRAMHLLKDMDRTETGLREKLHHGMYPPEAVDAAIEYVRSFGYLNDERFAENFVRSRQGKKSRKEIIAALAAKGIGSELAEKALEKCDMESGEKEAVHSLMRKKKFDPQHADKAQMHRIYSFFARKGFRYDTVRQVIQNYDQDA